MRGTEGGGPADARGRQRHLSPAFLSLPGAHHSKAWGLCQPGRTCPLPPPAPVVFVPGSSSWWTSFVACPLPKGQSPPPLLSSRQPCQVGAAMSLVSLSGPRSACLPATAQRAPHPVPSHSGHGAHGCHPHCLDRDCLGCIPQRPGLGDLRAEPALAKTGRVSRAGCPCSALEVVLLLCQALRPGDRGGLWEGLQQSASPFSSGATPRGCYQELLPQVQWQPPPSSRCRQTAPVQLMRGGGEFLPLPSPLVVSPPLRWPWRAGMGRLELPRVPQERGRQSRGTPAQSCGGKGVLPAHILQCRSSI